MIPCSAARPFASACLAVALVVESVSARAAEDRWAHYGGSLAGDRYASPSAITPESVEHLSRAWTYRTGDATSGRGFDGNPSRIRATPILVQGKLIVSTGFNRVYALNPGTGEEIWKYDPKVDFSRPYSEMFVSRGVAAWQAPASVTGPCRTRVFLGTLDARLIAIDADTGAPCTGFGDGGEVDLSVGIRRYYKWDYSVTSPPTVVGQVVVVGSAVGDNGAAELQPGTVRGYDVADGSLLWAWDPLPRDDDHPGADGWANPERNLTGGANVWSVMAADPVRGLVFLPTTSPSPDFYGGKRLGDNAFANSVVALRASTGEFAWGYQTVRHDLWDYDLAAQPLLFDHASGEGVQTPAVAHAGKTGFVFVLDRETGEPLHPVEERPVPQSDVPGEQAARTQPFPKLRLHGELCSKMHREKAPTPSRMPGLASTMLRAGWLEWSNALGWQPPLLYPTKEKAPDWIEGFRDRLSPRVSVWNGTVQGAPTPCGAEILPRDQPDMGTAARDVPLGRCR